MRRVAVLLTASLLPLAFAAAQAVVTNAKQPAANPANRGLQGEAKLRYILKQLDLDKEQKEHAETLLAVYEHDIQAERANAVNRIQEIRGILVEIQTAEKEGKKDEVERLKKSLENYRSGVVPERTFYEGLEAILKPEQKEVLTAVRARLQDNPDVQLTPADVAKVARDQKLNEEQTAKLTKLTEELRAKQQSTPAADAAAQAKLLEDFIKEVRGILTPEQAPAFDRQIEKMRPDPQPAPQAPAPPGAPEAPKAP